MKYCPTCRNEFEDWVEKCPDCAVDLVDSLPLLPEEIKSSPTEPLVIIAKYSMLVDANLIKEILESEGIHPVAVEEVEPSTRWFSASEPGGTYVLVRAEDAVKAIEIVKSVTEIEPIIISDIDGDDDDTDDDDENTAD